MSTFNGIVVEFPDIRVDFFRANAQAPRPLACFLSHIHSDHLAGLESLRSPFVYCSAATRELLLRLERYPCRINYAKGILEAREQRYKHLRNLLKPLPLETPTVLELEPGNRLQVTLLDANHCPGSVMFLFEGAGKAVLYTGDIRSEPWFVNSIARIPCLVEYTCGIKTLDKIYLDTSFTEDVTFQTKAEGIQELLWKVAQYPDDTIFHLQAWTFGYEQVWVALSKALNSKIHVDEYKLRLYKSLVCNSHGAELHMTPEAPALVGFMCGNSHHPGCLTSNETVRLHSCEKGNYCSTVMKSSQVVWIQPIVAHSSDGQDVAEVGIGGGGDDLIREAELDFISPADVDDLLKLICGDNIVPEALKDEMEVVLLSAAKSRRSLPLDLEVSSFDEKNEIGIANVVRAVTKRLRLGGRRDSNSPTRANKPAVITFPYSRHSSYPELCGLVQALRPKDVWPCTVDQSKWLTAGINVESLFGPYCSASTFQHDEYMAGVAQARATFTRNKDSQRSQLSSDEPVEVIEESFLQEPHTTSCQVGVAHEASPPRLHEPVDESSPEPISDSQWRTSDAGELSYPADSQESRTSDRAFPDRRSAFETMIQNERSSQWSTPLLISTSDNHSKLDEGLGG